MVLLIKYKKKREERLAYLSIEFVNGFEDLSEDGDGEVDNGKNVLVAPLAD